MATKSLPAVMERREVFREENWTVSALGPRPRIDVGHLNCPKTIRDCSEDLEVEGPVTYTWFYNDKCYFCHEEFPEFIGNMLVFIAWCGGR